MRLLRKRKRVRITGPTLTDQIGLYLNARHRKLADYLNDKVKDTPKQSVKYGLIGFCLIVSVYLIWLIAGAF